MEAGAARAGEAEQASSEMGAPERDATIDEQRQQGLGVRQSQGPCESLGQASALPKTLGEEGPFTTHQHANGHTKHKTFTPRTHHTRFIQMLAFIHNTPTHQHANGHTKQKLHTSHTSHPLHSHARDVRRIPRSQTRIRVATPRVNPGSERLNPCNHLTRQACGP